MDAGAWASIIIGIGVAGHAVVGTVLTTRLAKSTEPLWRRFGTLDRLTWLNGLLLVIAALLHLAVSWIKVADATGVVFWSSIAPFPFYAVAGALEMRQRTGWAHHAVMAAGWLAFAWHATVAA